jgi:hypothetical protein
VAAAAEKAMERADEAKGGGMTKGTKRGKQTGVNLSEGE